MTTSYSLGNNLSFGDEFEEFRARSYSGGFRPHRSKSALSKLRKPSMEEDDIDAAVISWLAEGHKDSASTSDPCLKCNHILQPETGKSLTSVNDNTHVTSCLCRNAKTTEVQLSGQSGSGISRHANQDRQILGSSYVQRPRVYSMPACAKRPFWGMSKSKEQGWKTESANRDWIACVDKRERCHTMDSMRHFTITGNRLHKLPRNSQNVFEYNAGNAEQGPLHSSIKCPTETTALHCSPAGMDRNPDVHKVAVVGHPGVGKSALVGKFIDNADIAQSFDDETSQSVSVVLDGSPSTLVFIIVSCTEDLLQNIPKADIDAILVIYSIEDRRSFEAAIGALYEIKGETYSHITSILVGNKSDLVRTRAVLDHEGTAAANANGAKFIEVSAAIDLKVDELLVGTLKQIRLVKEKRRKIKSHASLHICFADVCSSATSCLHKARSNVLRKILKGTHTASLSKSCEDLYVL